MLRELYRTLEHKVTFTVQLIPGTYSGAPLGLRSVYGTVAPALPHHYTPDAGMKKRSKYVNETTFRRELY